MELGEFKKKCSNPIIHAVSILEEDLKNCVRCEETGKYKDIKEQIEKVGVQQPVTKHKRKCVDVLGFDGGSQLPHEVVGSGAKGRGSSEGESR